MIDYIMGLSAETLLFILIEALIIIALIILIALGIRFYEPGNRRAGREGEEYVSDLIRNVLHDDDFLLTNVSISTNDKEAEMDNIIVNTNGVFVIEVKNYSGELIGEEDDYEWEKRKISSGGEEYIKSVKNPIKQVKRQVYVLSQLLKENNIKVWIDGYAFLVERNSPVDSQYILESREDIDAVIHQKKGKGISPQTVKRIYKLLEEYVDE